MMITNKSILVLCCCFALTGAHPLVDPIIFESSNDVTAAAICRMGNDQSGTCTSPYSPSLKSCWVSGGAYIRLCKLIDGEEEDVLTFGFCCPTSTDPNPVTCGTTSLPGSTSTPRPAGAVCGVGPKDTIPTFEESKIVGGKPAEPNSWPFQVAIFKNDSFNCGGSLLDAYHILTAAHCIADEKGLLINAEQLKVVLGMHTFKDNDVVRRNITRAILHKNYNPISFKYDIAILRMDEPVTFTKKISPVCLPAPTDSDDEYADDYDSVVIGWGRTSWGGAESDVLKQVTLKVISKDKCKKIFENAIANGVPVKIEDNMLCVSVSPRESSCQGDSGGPLVIKGASGWTQAGIVSYGMDTVSEGCGLPGYPSIYTRVASFSKWIAENSRL